MPQIVVRGCAFPVEGKSDASNMSDRVEENMMHAMFSVDRIMRYPMALPWREQGLPIQVYMMEIADTVARHFGVDKDALLEQYLAHDGIRVLAQAMGRE